MPESQPIPFSWNTHLERVLLSTRERWNRTTLALGFVLFGLAVLTHFLDISSYQSKQNFWLRNLEMPVLIVFLMSTYPFLRHLFSLACRAMEEIHVSREEFTAAAQRYASTIEGEVAWFIIGVSVGWLLFRPWKWGLLWRTPYLFLSEALLFGICGWMAYFLIKSALFLGHLHTQPTQYNIFDSQQLKPIADWSLGLTVLIIGMISLSIFLTPSAATNKAYLTAYIGACLFELFVFVSSMWTTHRYIKKQKDQRLRELRWMLEKVRQQVLAHSQIKRTTSGLSAELKETCQTYILLEERLMRVSEWPLAPSTIRNFLLVVLLPLFVWFLRNFLIKVL